MLETIREYALETIANSGELEATEEVHAMYYLTLAERGDPELFGHQQHLWVVRLTRDFENLRAALQWLLAQQHQESLLRLASSLGWFWYMCGRLSEGMLLLEHALRGIGQDVAISARIKALCYEAFIALHLGLIDLHTSRSQECLTLARQQRDYRCFALASWSLVHYLLARGDVLEARVQAEETMAFVWIPGTSDEGWSLACALNAVGSVILYQGDYAQTRDVFERATDLFKKVGDLWLYGEMHLRLADVYLAQGDEMKGRTLLDERVAIHTQADNSWATGWFLGLFGQIALRQGAIARARILLEAAMKRHQQLGDQQGKALIYALLAQAAASEHDYMLSRSLAAQSLEIAHTVQDTGSLILCLEELADVVAGQGEPAWAAVLWGAAERYREASNATLPLVERLGRARHIEQAKSLVGERVFAEKWAEGRNMTAEQAIAVPHTDDLTS
jgi:tetratricopeptide (TPR) repeat protein